jgi:hypothetical protein
VGRPIRSRDGGAGLRASLVSLEPLPDGRLERLGGRLEDRIPGAVTAVSDLEHQPPVDPDLPAIVRFRVETDERDIDSVLVFEPVDHLVFQRPVTELRRSVRPEVVSLELGGRTSPPVRSLTLVERL